LWDLKLKSGRKLFSKYRKTFIKTLARVKRTSDLIRRLGFWSSRRSFIRKISTVRKVSKKERREKKNKWSDGLG